MRAYQWLYFHDNGMVAMLQTKISKNLNYVGEAQNAGFYDPDSTMQCYIINYDIDGKVTSEGWCIYKEDLEAEGQEVGIWKYYTPQGVSIVNKSLEY